MHLLLRWGAPLFFLVVFVLCAFTNFDILFGLTPSMRALHAKGQRISGVSLVGGIAGAIAFWNWPEPDLSYWAWLPFVIDFPGTLGIGRGAVEQKPADASPEEAEHRRAAEAKRIADEQARIAEDARARESRRMALERAAIGCLLGTAIGDALGLAREGLRPERARKLFPDPARYALLFGGYGLCSDDTEHTVMLAQSLAESSSYAFDIDYHTSVVRGHFAWRLRFWLLGLPAGIGMATLKGILKLWLFLPERWCGIGSAGNAPAMRAAIIGVAHGDEPERMRALVTMATRITHADPKAEFAAQAVALAAKISMVQGGRLGIAELREGLGAIGDDEFRALLAGVEASVAARQSTVDFARALGLARGVTGYSYHTLPVALHAVLTHPADYRGAVRAAIDCGGDTDTVAAIVGGIVGAGVGREGLPAEWLARLVEWPRSVRWIEELGAALAARLVERGANAVPTVGIIKLLARNLVFLVVVLVHGFRRMLPPY